jgi:hypothetical protein
MEAVLFRFAEDTEVVDVFAPPPEDFLTGVGHEMRRKQTSIVYRSRRHLTARTRVVIDCCSSKPTNSKRQLEHTAAKSPAAVDCAALDPASPLNAQDLCRTRQFNNPDAVVTFKLTSRSSAASSTGDGAVRPKM